MRNFEGIIFIQTQMYRKIFKSILVYLEGISFSGCFHIRFAMLKEICSGCYHTE